MTTKPATEKQISLIKKLAEERAIPSDWDLSTVIPHLTSIAASVLITTALTYPRKTNVAPKPVTGLQEALAAVPKAKYAVAFEDLTPFIPGLKSEGQGYLFVEVKEYMKRLYIRRLHGSVGDFTRTPIKPEYAVSILKLIALNPLAHSQKFGELFTVCGVCTAPLTDDKSRELNLGPECRKRFGL